MHTVPVTPAVVRVLMEERSRQALQAARVREARAARARPGRDTDRNRPVSAWSSLLIAVRLRPAG